VTDVSEAHQDPAPLLTIAVPTYQRPDLLRRALASIVQAITEPSAVEVVISDNSPDVSGPEIERFRAAWTGRLRYLPNVPTIDTVSNWNQCIKVATGRYVLFIHDDDYLLPDVGPGLLAALRRAPADEHVFLFGVRVVTLEGRVRRQQTHRRERGLSPAEALHRILTNSSYVRTPGLVIRRDAFDEVGLFDAAVRVPTDFDLETRMFARYGVRLEPEVVAGYTVHQAGVTTGMFHAGTIDDLMPIFERVAAMGVLSPEEVRHRQRHWMHQFVLGGVYRKLEVGDRVGAAEVLHLLDLPQVRALGLSWRWLPVRVMFSVIVRLPFVGKHAT
jgi:glycosyltransferase involved in cell wall biosynthesis